MQSFDFIKQSPFQESFRTNKLVGMFELQPEHLTQHFQGTIETPENWNIGVIVGRSGTGKSSIARQLFGISVGNVFTDKPIIDEMPSMKTVDEITKIFTNVGFSSPPAWLKPYSVLSNGEKMRVDLAYHLLSEDEVIVFDEFTSVVDRDVAKICSMVVQKQIRTENRKFIAVTCHYDVLEYLEPDWVFSTDEMKSLTDFKKKREPIELKIFRAERDTWRIFRNYHYMNSDLNPSSHVFVATLWGKMIGFIAVIHFPHPSVSNMKKVTRLVVLPDYQGIGIGKKLLNFVGEYYTKKGMRMTITTSHPALNRSLKKPWILMRQGRVKDSKTTDVGLSKTLSKHRNTCTWEYTP